MAKRSWAKHMTDHPAYYGAIIFGRTKHITPTQIVTAVLKANATGDWATKTFKENGASAVLVRFALQSDFDAMYAKFNGKASQNSIFVKPIAVFDAIIQ